MNIIKSILMVDLSWKSATTFRIWNQQKLKCNQQNKKWNRSGFIKGKREIVSILPSLDTICLKTLALQGFSACIRIFFQCVRDFFYNVPYSLDTLGFQNPYHRTLGFCKNPTFRTIDFIKSLLFGHIHFQNPIFRTRTVLDFNSEAYCNKCSWIGG